MLTIKQALEMDLSEDLKSEIRKYDANSALALTLDDKLFVIPRTSENEHWFRKEEIYDKIREDNNAELTNEELELIGEDLLQPWAAPAGIDRGCIDVTTVDISDKLK